MGDMGTIHFDQGVGKGGLSTIDDKLPSMLMKSQWDSIDAAATTSSNGLVGMGNSWCIRYEKRHSGYNLSSVQVWKRSISLTMVLMMQQVVDKWSRFILGFRFDLTSSMGV